MGTPHKVCSTFARLDFILVPLPAARTTAKIGELSDIGCVALPSLASPASRALGGWGGRIRTCDPGTKTRCLATWPRPKNQPAPAAPQVYRSPYKSSEALPTKAPHAVSDQPPVRGHGSLLGPAYPGRSLTAQAGERLVDQGIQRGATLDRGVEVLQEPARHALLRRLADLQPAAGQPPSSSKTTLFPFRITRPMEKGT